MLFFFALLVGIIFLDFIPKRKEISKSIRIVYMGILLVSVVLMLLTSTYIPIPSFSSVLESGIKSLLGQ